MNTDTETENEIIEMLESYAYTDKNPDAMMDLFSDYTNIVAIYTGQDE
ncbi:hypothetical protein [Methanobacterium sp. ACI-7]